MSTTLFSEYGLYVTRVAAPACEGTDRRRIEFYVSSPARLTIDEVRDLVSVLNAEILRAAGRVGVEQP